MDIIIHTGYLRWAISHRIILPKALVDKFNDWLGREAVDANRHGEYRKWLRYYLDFCHKYGHGYLEQRSLGLFITEKLQAKGQRSFQIEEASCAVRLYYRMAGETNDIPSPPASEPEITSKTPPWAPARAPISWFLADAVRFSEAEKTRFASLWNEAKPGVMFKDRGEEE